MSRYDFTSLSSQDFEELARDLLQAEWNVALEAFKAGRDKGIDLRYAPANGAKPLSGANTMVAAMRRKPISGTYIQSDETPVNVQMHKAAEERTIKHIWGSTVALQEPWCSTFAWGRGCDGPKHFLGPFEGILQTDGYAAYDQISGTRMVHAPCWAHARRQFFEAVQLNPRDPVATPIVARMDELFAVDAEARRRVIGLTGASCSASGKSQASPG